MLLHRLHLNPRCGETRRDLADPYQMHSTLCRAFSRADQKCPEGMFLWRLEPETGPHGQPRLLVQSRSPADWSRINIADWVANADPAIDLTSRLRLGLLQAGQRFRYRLRANPSVTRNHKRLGLLRLAEQQAWMARKGELHGFALPPMVPSSDTAERGFEVRVSEVQMLYGRQHTGNGIRVFAALFDGLLTVTDATKFHEALRTGIGHGKAMGLGLLSVVPTG